MNLIRHSLNLIRHSREGGQHHEADSTLVLKLNKNNLFTNRGIASMAEIVLVSGIFLTLMSLGIFNITRFQSSSSLSTIVDTFVADFKNQQIKAMQGDIESGTAPDNYGIHFDTTSYTLFKGTWTPGSPDNFTINIPESIQVSTNYPNQVIYFIKGDGHVASWNYAYNISFNDNPSNIHKTISPSYWGAIIVE